MSEFEETVVGVPPEGWSLGHVTITRRSGLKPKPVEAWRRGSNMQGLYVPAS